MSKIQLCVPSLDRPGQDPRVGLVMLPDDGAYFAIGGRVLVDTARPKLAVLTRQGAEDSPLAFGNLFHEPVGTDKLWAMWFNVWGVPGILKDEKNGVFSLFVYQPNPGGGRPERLECIERLTFSPLEPNARYRTQVQVTYPTSGNVAHGPIVSYGGFNPGDTTILRVELRPGSIILYTDSNPFHNTVGYWAGTLNYSNSAHQVHVEAVGNASVGQGGPFEIQ